MSRKPAEWYIRDADGLNRREREFCLFYLASGGKRKKWAAEKAGFSGDHAKRARDLLDKSYIQAFLDKYAPPRNLYKVTADKESIIKRLEQVASGEGVTSKTASIELKAIELMGKAQGMWEGTSSEGKSRLHEITACIAAGPIERGSLPCAKCQHMCSPTAKFCGECGILIEREKTPEEKLVAAKKKVGKAEVIQ
jgi:hypothetical protein